MNANLDLPIRINLDLYFGRLAPLSPDPSERATVIQSAADLQHDIAAQILNQTSDGWTDLDIQRYVFSNANALPPWLVNKALCACDNPAQQLETAINDLLTDALSRRRLLDYICGELAVFCWRWLDDDKKRSWVARRTTEQGGNAFAKELGLADYVLKISNGLLGPGVKRDSELYRWYVGSIGTLNLVDFTTKSIYQHTAKLLLGKYKTSFILDVFKKLFGEALHAQGLDHWGVLVVDDAPKLFSLGDFLARAPRCQCLAKTEPGVSDLLCLALDCFDDPAACPGPDARFRLGSRPPQEVLDRIGAMFWLRRTLDEVKSIQQRKEPQRHGLRVGERPFLAMAMKQKRILYCNLFDERLDPVINPCSIQSIQDEGMVLSSPKGNKLNACQPGQEIHGYFSIIDGKNKSTYCDFRTTVRSVQSTEDGTVLAEIAFPAAFELTRRSHKRLHLDMGQLKEFSLVALPPGADPTSWSNLENWPEPLCRLPQQAGWCEIKDLSAGGLMLAISEDAPGFEQLAGDERDVPLLALLHLAGQQNLPDLRLPLCLAVKRVRHYAPLRAKYLGVQFTEAGEIRNQKYVRWQPVGKEGVFLIADWIFRDTISR